MTTTSYADSPFRQCAGCGDDIWPGEAYGVSASGEICAICLATRQIDCSGCRCCPAGACEPGEPLGPGVCGHTCPCHPDFHREAE